MAGVGGAWTCEPTRPRFCVSIFVEPRDWRQRDGCLLSPESVVQQTPPARPGAGLSLPALIQSGLAVTVPLRRSAFRRDACVGVLGDPVHDRLVGVTDATPATSDELRAAAVLSETLQCPRREMEKARSVLFEMYYQAGPLLFPRRLCRATAANL